MNVSLIMAACNQGHFAAETVASARSNGLVGSKNTEILIVDDCSDDGCCDNLEKRFGVQVFRNPQRLGCAQSRRIAARMTSNDIIVLSDPHCLFPRRSLTELAKIARDSFAIIQPAVMMEGRHRICGGVPALRRRGFSVNRPTYPKPAPFLFGSIYAMRRDVYEALGGFPWLPGKWGRWEQCMSLIAYRLAVPIVVHDRITCTHRHYRKKGFYPFAMSTSEEGKNSHVAHASTLPDSYNELWVDVINKYHCELGAKESEIMAPLAHEEFRVLSRYIDKHAKLSEQETYLRLFGLKHPLDSFKFRDEIGR